MRTLGIDLGSREVKMIVMEDEEIVMRKKFGTMAFYRDYCVYQNGLKAELSRLGAVGADASVSTGYGRNNTDLKNFTAIHEVKAHVYGAMHQTKRKDFVLLDIGGQDVKAAKVEKGVITDVELNEKCAASCGRYLENMAAVLELPVEEVYAHSEEPVALNSTCAVFSESELIGKIAEGADIKRLCAGVNYAMYKRIRPILAKFKSRLLLVSGGVAYDTALVSYLKNDFDEVAVLPEPQYNGAIGCCRYAAMLMK